MSVLVLVLSSVSRGRGTSAALEAASSCEDPIVSTTVVSCVSSDWPIISFTFSVKQ